MARAPNELVRLFQTAASRRRFDTGTTAYRLVDAEGDGIPDVTVDWLDGVAILSLYRQFGDEEAAIASALEEAVRPRAIYLKRRPVEARKSAGDLSLLAPEEPIRGERVDCLEVREDGVAFEVRPPNGLSVGLYLDGRDARAWVHRNARGRRVLNTFAYTCGFGIAAQLGGAVRALNVDLSRKVLDWGMKNARLNGLPAEPGNYLAGDAFDWLSRFRKKREQFDLLILDPPSFATSKKRRFSAGSDFSELVCLAAPLVATGGALLCSTNLAAVPQGKLAAMVANGLTRGGREGRIVERMSAPRIDFPSRAKGALKGLVFRLDAGSRVHSHFRCPPPQHKRHGKNRPVSESTR